MGAALGGRDGMDLVDYEPTHRGEDPPCGAGEDEVERLRRRDEDVGRVPLHGAANFGWRVAGADGGKDFGRHSAPGFDLVTDPHQRRAQVAIDVVSEGLQRRYIKDATPLRLGRGGFRRQAIEAPEKGGQRLAAAGRRGHENVAAGRDFTPAALLNRGGFRESRAKPFPGRRCKEVENVPHATKFDRFRAYKQVFVVKIASLWTPSGSAR